MTDTFRFAPDRQGYSFIPGYSYQDIPLEGGPARKKQTALFNPHLVQAPFIFKADEYGEAMGFLRDHQEEDFLLDIIADIGIPTTHVCRLIGEPVLTRQTGDAYYVSTKLEADQNPTWTGTITYTDTGRITAAVAHQKFPHYHNDNIPQTFQAGNQVRVLYSKGNLVVSGRAVNMDGIYTIDSTIGTTILVLDNPSSVNSDWTVLVDEVTDYGGSLTGNITSTITRVPT